MIKASRRCCLTPRCLRPRGGSSMVPRSSVGPPGRHPLSCCIDCILVLVVVLANSVSATKHPFLFRCVWDSVSCWIPRGGAARTGSGAFESSLGCEKEATRQSVRARAASGRDLSPRSGFPGRPIARSGRALSPGEHHNGLSPDCRKNGSGKRTATPASGNPSIASISSSIRGGTGASCQGPNHSALA